MQTVRSHALLSDTAQLFDALDARSNFEPITQSVRDLADLYLQVAERLLDVIHDQPHNLRVARALSDHLEWVGARATLLRGFIEAGDEAVGYICASAEATRRLASLVKLAKEKLGEPGRLSVVLHLLERIDEELRLI